LAGTLNGGENQRVMRLLNSGTAIDRWTPVSCATRLESARILDDGETRAPAGRG
jgi:hypothetical protein